MPLSPLLSRELSVRSLRPRLLRMQLHRQPPRVQVSPGGQSCQQNPRWCTSYNCKLICPPTTGQVPHHPGVWASWSFNSCGVFPAVVHPEASRQRLNRENSPCLCYTAFFWGFFSFIVKFASVYVCLLANWHFKNGGPSLTFCCFLTDMHQIVRCTYF